MILLINTSSNAPLEIKIILYPTLADPEPPTPEQMQCETPTSAAHTEGKLEESPSASLLQSLYLISAGASARARFAGRVSLQAKINCSFFVLGRRLTISISELSHFEGCHASSAENGPSVATWDGVSMAKCSGTCSRSRGLNLSFLQNLELPVRLS